MRRLEFLINQVRSSTSNKSNSKITQQDFVNYFNLAQDAIQKIAMNADTGARLFNTIGYITLVPQQEGYDLPSDIFSNNTISSVRISQNLSSAQPQYYPLEKITEKERGRSFGYAVNGDMLYVSPSPKWTVGDQLEIAYQKKIPRLGVRSGTVTSYNAITGEILLATGHDSDISSYDDFFCLCDSNGVIKNTNLPIVSFDNATHKLFTTTGLTITNGTFVVIGKNSTTNSELKDICESYLISFVERKVFHKDSVIDLNNQQVFTAEEQTEIAGIFALNSKDSIYPPVVNTDYLWI